MESFIYSLGFFDGVHIGHRALLNACSTLASENHCKAGVVTFSSHPDTLVSGNTPGLINTFSDRDSLLHLYGAENILSLPFDEKMKTTSWTDFLEMLFAEHGAVGFVCGDDFRFGNRGEGNAALLADFCRKRDLPFVSVPEQTIDGIRVSSTFIRTLLRQGSMEKAVEFLGHPHILSGNVVHGQHLGSRLGFPTANLIFPVSLAAPRFGVYACTADTPDGQFLSVTNIGTRPTVGGSGITVENWLLDYSGDLYDKEITLHFHSFLRPEIKFDSLEALKTEVLHNAEQVRELYRVLLPY